MASSGLNGSCFTATSGDGAFATCDREGTSSVSSLILVVVIGSSSSFARLGSVIRSESVIGEEAEEEVVVVLNVVDRVKSMEPISVSVLLKALACNIAVWLLIVLGNKEEEEGVAV